MGSSHNSNSSVDENKDNSVNNEVFPPPLEPPTPKIKSRVDHIASAAPPAYVIRKILGHRVSMFGATNASNVQEAVSASNRQVNAGRGKYKRHAGVDYLVEWEEEYAGQWGKNKKQWVRDIDILTPQAIEQYKRSENDENKSHYCNLRTSINRNQQLMMINMTDMKMMNELKKTTTKKIQSTTHKSKAKQRDGKKAKSKGNCSHNKIEKSKGKSTHHKKSQGNCSHNKTVKNNGNC
jgi:hypothetical protein